MTERKLPRYQPTSHDSSLRRAFEVPEGSNVFVYLTRQGVKPFRAEVISIEETKGPDPRVRTQTKERVYQRNKSELEVVYQAGKELLLGAGTSMRILPNKGTK